MFKIIIPILVIALAAFVGMNAKSGLIRGVADGMLVSPARPAVAVKPAADFASVDARRVDLSPSVQNSMLQATSVQAVYALYNHEDPQAAPAHLAALLAVSQNDETWPVEPELGFPAIRHKKQDIDGFSGFADTYVLDAKDDPWASDEPAQWENGSLVRRFTFILWFYKAKLIVEYREPLPAPSDMPLEDNIPLLTAFEARALESFRLLNGDPKNGGVELPRPKEKLPYPPAGINRAGAHRFYRHALGYEEIGGRLMPYVNIRVTRENGTPTAEQKEELIKGATELLVRVLGKNPATTVVVIDEVDTDNWGVGGETVTRRRRQGK